MGEHGQRLSVILSAEDSGALDAVAVRRFGRNRSEVARAGIALAAAVYSDPATVDATTPAEALAAYVKARRK